MSDLTKTMNQLLFEIDEKRWISLTKDSPKKIFKAKDKLRAFGLIERQNKYSWRLTQSGYEAVELGGFDEWLSQNQTDKNQELAQNFFADKINVSNGKSNTINDNSKKDRNTDSTLKKIFIGVIITILGGFILFYIEKNLNSDFENETNLNKNTTQPINVVFNDGKKAEVNYTINLSLIDSLILNTAKQFANEEKAVDYIVLRAKNQLITVLESTTLNNARLKRDSLASTIIEKTINEQIYSGYKINSLFINEINTVYK